jgi:hypothetical protein
MENKLYKTVRKLICSNKDKEVEILKVIQVLKFIGNYKNFRKI